MSVVCVIFKRATVSIATQLRTMGPSDGIQLQVQLHPDKPLKTTHNLPLTTAAAQPTHSDWLGLSFA